MSSAVGNSLLKEEKGGCTRTGRDLTSRANRRNKGKQERDREYKGNSLWCKSAASVVAWANSSGEGSDLEDFRGKGSAPEILLGGQNEIK